MKRIVFASGVWNLVLGAGLLAPPVYGSIGMRIPHPFWGWLLCGFLGFTSAVLILASRDLEGRGALVYWEGLLRYAAAALLLTIGPGVIGWPAWFIGVTDLAWGLILTFGLAGALRTSHRRLLFDALEKRA